jgi:hypothetical protein
MALSQNAPSASINALFVISDAALRGVDWQNVELHPCGGKAKLIAVRGTRRTSVKAKGRPEFRAGLFP